MGKNQQFIKLFIVLFLCTGFIFSFSHFAAKAFENLTNADGKYSNGTTIGLIDISGMSESEVVGLLKNRYSDWVKNAKINLQYNEKSAGIDLKEFKLDSSTTISSIKNGQSNPIFVTIDKSKAEEQIQILFPQINTKGVDLDKLTNSLNETGSKLDKGPYSFDLYNDFSLPGTHDTVDVVSRTTLNLNVVPIDLQDLLNLTSKIEIPGESEFSFLEFAKKQHIEEFPSLNIMVTGMYQTILHTNFSIVERNIGSKLPSYASLGNEAKVDDQSKADFIIKNPNKGKYTLEFKLAKKHLTVTLKGEKLMYSYKITKKNKQELKPKTILQYSPLLLSGQTKIQTKGENGRIVKVYRNVYEGDQFIKTDLISEDYYPPVYRVEVHGLAGSTQGTSSASTGTADNETDSSTSNDSNENQSITSDSTQKSSNDSNLWGKPNEQPK
ncbi:G5 domain-containing protein [Bacillus salipaludis]|uniref:G5 domain-containing protein n=1 Tax=Bacillus salipaludis TaxID=2547811 RepID=A0AA90QUH6_9BACI|nr:G5 domain-containing protein [Bacillus salipaludis]MDQ6599830.1 G5 domain-containing protein [Bacillus salipaludis]